ncbi:MAG TPA: proline racemase family protein [Candidatus Sulfotelmatobacter sp.]|nr:proline racemase family protein [Candidatus Sulfotelmatobacter sp.]
MNTGIHRLRVIDSHTAGEPTRIIISGAPDLGQGSVASKLAVFRDKFDSIRSAVVNEPRGSDAIVGALLCPPSDPGCSAGVIFFNNVGYLGMCGHGTIGLMVTLAHLGKLSPGEHQIETPVGKVTACLDGNGRATVQNVPSYRHATKVKVDVPGHGPVTGDIAWGGNWFFLVNDHGMHIAFSHIDRLTEFTWNIRQQLTRHRITGANGQEIDHIELFGPPEAPEADSKNFVLCPGKSYDRSPCGTGTSAKMACLYADGKLRSGEVWRQESIVGSIFEGTITERDGELHPTITGSAFVNADSELILDPQDPFCFGIRK